MTEKYNFYVDPNVASTPLGPLPVTFLNKVYAHVAVPGAAETLCGINVNALVSFDANGPWTDICSECGEKCDGPIITASVF